MGEGTTKQPSNPIKREDDPKPEQAKQAYNDTEPKGNARANPSNVPAIVK